MRIPWCNELVEKNPVADATRLGKNPDLVGKSALEVLIWKLTGLDLKLQQYRRGEAFCQAVFDRHGLEVLNRVWSGPESMPKLNELGNPDAWYRRTSA